MRYSFLPMTIDYLNIIKNWKYDGVVKDIYIEPYYKSHREGDDKLRGPGGCYGYGVLEGGKLIGLFEYYLSDDIMEIGLALAPGMTGRGLGEEFVLEGINFGIKEFNYNREYIKLSVDVNNHPAIRVYDKAGFIKVDEDDNEIKMHWYL